MLCAKGSANATPVWHLRACSGAARRPFTNRFWSAAPVLGATLDLRAQCKAKLAERRDALDRSAAGALADAHRLLTRAKRRCWITPVGATTVAWLLCAQSGCLAESVLVTGLAIEQKPGSRPTTCLLAFRSGSPAVGPSPRRWRSSRGSGWLLELAAVLAQLAVGRIEGCDFRRYSQTFPVSPHERVWTPGRVSHSVSIERRDVPGRLALCRRLSINSPSGAVAMRVCGAGGDGCDRVTIFPVGLKDLGADR
jgi:hypothetical protein